MATKKLSALIKEARTGAGLTQEQLAKKVTGMSASDISKAERGEKVPTQDQLKQIAKATGVTQKSLLDAAKGKTSSTVIPASSASSASTSSVKLTAAEKKLVQLYRKADDEKKKKVVELLSEKEQETVASSLGSGLLDTFLGLFRGGPGEGEEGGEQQ